VDFLRAILAVCRTLKCQTVPAGTVPAHSEKPMSEAESKAQLKARLLAECMEVYRVAKTTKHLPALYGGIYRRWLDDVFSTRTKERVPIRDDHGSVLRRWGPPLAWFDQVTRGGRDGSMASELDFFLERNGLYLVIEFKSAHGERRKLAGSDQLSIGQWRALATLPKSGLFVVYVVEYTEPGSNDAPPTVSRIRRLTDDVAPSRRWERADFGDLLVKVHEWWTNAGDANFVRSQRASATFMQFLQLKLNIAGYTKTDSQESIKIRRAQHEAMRIAARWLRAERVATSWETFLAVFEAKCQEKLSGAGDESSTA